MRQHDDGLLARLPDAREFRPHTFAGHRVEGGERLVEQEQVGVMDERARDRHALRHPAGEVARIRVFESLQADQFDHLAGLGARHRFSDVFDLQRKFDVFDHRPPGHQVRALKDHADAGLFAVTERERAGGRRDQPGKDAEQGGLARAGGSQHAHELARTHVEGDRVERVQSAVLVGEHGGQVAEGEDGGVRHIFIDVIASEAKQSPT